MTESGTNPNAREIAERLLVYEAADPSAPAQNTVPAMHVCQKLGRPLSQLVGETGSRALLARALTLAKREEEVLIPVKVSEQGALEGLEGKAAEASAVIVVELIGLVLTFLGEALTIRLVRDVWPDRAASDMHFGERNGNEQAQ